jgi:hypothetical protein
MNAVASAESGLRGWIDSHLDETWRARVQPLLPRESGVPHPPGSELLDTLNLLADLRADAETFAACIVHALPPADAGEALAAVCRDAPRVRDLVEGQQAAEKVWSLYAARSGAGHAEGLRRLLLAIIRDLRVVLILLARQLVRLRAAAKAPPDQRRALAQLTADIHAPLANRLGIWQMKWEPAAGHLPAHRAPARRAPCRSRALHRACHRQAARGAGRGRDRGADCRPSQAHLLDLEEDAAQGRGFRLALRHPRTARAGRRCRRLLRRARRGAQPVAAGAERIR